MTDKAISEGKIRRPRISVATFNQNSRSLCVGFQNDGFRIISIAAVDKLDAVYDSTIAAADSNENFVIAERLFDSSLVALVSQVEPRKLRLIHFRKGHNICCYSYASNIMAVKLNRSRLVVCLERSILVHNVRDMRLLHTIQELAFNTSGLIALSAESDADGVEKPSYLAYPCSDALGEVQIFDTFNMATVVSIQAHSSQLAALTFSFSGHLLATASEKGTVLRVFELTKPAQSGIELRATRLFEFRRGMVRTARISSLSFSSCSNYLVCSSNTETVHVFHLARPSPSDVVGPVGSPPSSTVGDSDDATMTSPSTWVSSALSSVVEAASASVNQILPPLLPTHVSNALFVQGRACCVAYINDDLGPTAVDGELGDGGEATTNPLSSLSSTMLYGSPAAGDLPGHVCTLAVISNVLRLIVVSLRRSELYIYTVPNERNATNVDASSSSSSVGVSSSSGTGQSGNMGLCQMIHSFDLVKLCTKFGSAERQLRQNASYADKARPDSPPAEVDTFYELANAAQSGGKNPLELGDSYQFPPIS